MQSSGRDLRAGIGLYRPAHRQLTEIIKGLPKLAEAVDVWLTVCDEIDILCQGEGNEKPELEASLLGAS